jgi:hypothetical protein
MFKKLNFLTPIVCVFTMAGPVQAEKPRVGTVESELINHQGMLDSISMRLDRKKDELEVYRNYQEINAEIEESTRNLEASKKEIAGLAEQKIAVGDEASLVQLMFEDYRDQYRRSERLAAVGEILDLSETKGEAYQECKVLGISPLHLRVSRPTGAEGIPFKDLPVSVQDRFQFNNEEAAEYASKLAKSDTARALAYNQWKSGKSAPLPGVTSTDKAVQLTQLELLAKNTRDESVRLRKESDEWREKAARYWESISAAKSQSGQKSRETLASRAEGKADQYMELSRVARNEADRLDGEVHELKAQIKAEK